MPFYVGIDIFKYMYCSYSEFYWNRKFIFLWYRYLNNYCVNSNGKICLWFVCLFQCINLCLLKKMMFTLWFGVLCMACAPFFGFGIYWDEESSTCVRYRHAKKTLDVMYVYVYFSFGKHKLRTKTLLPNK